MSIHEPCPEYQMHWKVKVNTICATLRKIYKRTRDEEARILIRTAVTMAERMNEKLREYKKHWDEDFWDQPQRREKAMELTNKQRRKKRLTNKQRWAVRNNIGNKAKRRMVRETLSNKA